MLWQDTESTVTDPVGNISAYGFTWYPAGEVPNEYYVPQLKSVTDANGLTTFVRQNGAGFQSATYPEGNRLSVSRDDIGNVVQITHRPKSDSSLSNIISTATYPTSCSTPVLCLRPTQTTDEKGGVTDYTYDAAGNLLTMTRPAATLGAPRPQTRYVWEQRYAWYKQNGSSEITQAPSPVWVLVSQSECMTGATCQ